MKRQYRLTFTSRQPSASVLRTSIASQVRLSSMNLCWLSLSWFLISIFTLLSIHSNSKKNCIDFFFKIWFLLKRFSRKVDRSFYTVAPNISLNVLIVSLKVEKNLLLVFFPNCFFFRKRSSGQVECRFDTSAAKFLF